jgi:hypothetical protein
LRLQVVGSPNRDSTYAFDGDSESFAVRYVDAQGRTSAALLANRPLEAAALRRSLLEDALALAA